MLSQEQLIELYGGLPQEITVRTQGAGWFIETPCIMVPGTDGVGVMIQGGIHSQFAQLSHKVRRFAQEDLPVICLSQSGAGGVKKSPNFYNTGDYHRFVRRDLDILQVFQDACGISKVIVYGSSLGAAAAIALAAEATKKVAAVIVVAPASLIRQNPWWLVGKFVLSAFQKVEKDFKSPPTKPPSLLETVKELLGKAKDLNASDVGLRYLERTKCPVLIYSGRKDWVFPWRRLKELEGEFSNVRVCVRDDWIHSDPNSRAKIDKLVTSALERI